jgi:hypothetical protein
MHLDICITTHAVHCHNPKQNFSLSFSKETENALKKQHFLC